MESVRKKENIGSSVAAIPSANTSGVSRKTVAASSPPFSPVPEKRRVRKKSASALSRVASTHGSRTANAFSPNSFCAPANAQ